jgi:cytochrome P450
MSQSVSKPVRIKAKDRVLPHPPHRIPLLGDLWDLHITDSSQWGMKGAQRYGDIYERNIVGVRVTYVSDPDLLIEINDDRHWSKFLGVPIRNLREIARDGLFTAHNSEPNWAKAHAILAPSFTAQAMRGYHQTMVEVAGQLTSLWQGKPSGSWIDVSADMNKTTLEIIGRCAFGYDFDSFTDSGEHALVSAMLRELRYINRAAYSHPLVEKTVFRNQWKQHHADVQMVHALVDDVVATRKVTGPGGKGDLLDRMLVEADPETGELLDDANVRNQILTFLVAGHETSAGALAFALHYLSLNPKVVEDARREIETVWTDGTPTFEQVSKLRATRRIVDETLRLWPVAPGYFRKANADTMLGGQHPFEKGEWVFVVLLQLHRNALWGSDAEEFNPDRFLPERTRGRHPEIYRPFGVGMRACIGRQFAYHEILIVLATIIKNFDIEPDPDYTLQVRETITLKPEGLRVKLHPRRA